MLFIFHWLWHCPYPVGEQRLGVVCSVVSASVLYPPADSSLYGYNTITMAVRHSSDISGRCWNLFFFCLFFDPPHRSVFYILTLPIRLRIATVLCIVIVLQHVVFVFLVLFFISLPSSHWITIFVSLCHFLLFLYLAYFCCCDFFGNLQGNFTREQMKIVC